MDARSLTASAREGSEALTSEVDFFVDFCAFARWADGPAYDLLTAPPGYALVWALAFQIYI
jgi:hypothetical protein